jgi:hypothetical protein
MFNKLRSETARKAAPLVALGLVGATLAAAAAMRARGRREQAAQEQTGDSGDQRRSMWREAVGATLVAATLLGEKKHRDQVRTMAGDAWREMTQWATEHHIDPASIRDLGERVLGHFQQRPDGARSTGTPGGDETAVRTVPEEAVVVGDGGDGHKDPGGDESVLVGAPGAPAARPTSYTGQAPQVFHTGWPPAASPQPPYPIERIRV